MLQALDACGLLAHVDELWLKSRFGFKDAYQSRGWGRSLRIQGPRKAHKHKQYKGVYMGYPYPNFCL